MAGKLIDITPEVSLSATQIDMAFTDFMGDVFVKMVSGESLSVIPLPGETREMARQRIFAAVGADATDYEQLIEVAGGAWINPADVAQIIRYEGEERFSLIMRGDLPGVHLSGKVCSPEDIASRINAVMRERRSGLNAT